MYCRKNAFKAKQNMIHLNLSIALLLGLIVFVSGIETASDNKVSQAISYLHTYYDIHKSCSTYISYICVHNKKDI